MFLQIPIIKPDEIPADSVVKAKLIDKVSELAAMKPDELIHTIISWMFQVSGKILLALAVYWIGRKLIKQLSKLLNKVFERRDIDLSVRSFTRSLIEITLTIVLIATIVGILGINTTSFVAIFASAGLAVGMALSGTLQNFAGGVMVLMLKPYKVGDFIEAAGQTGTVKDIRLFNTLINTTDNKQIIIPNNSIATGIINNYSKESTRRVDWTVSIAYGDDYDAAREAIEDLLRNDSRILASPSPLIALSSLAASSVDITVRAWVQSSDYWDVFFDMNEKFYKILPAKGVNFPFPQLQIHTSDH